MLKSIYLSQFDKSLKKMKKRGKDPNKIKVVINLLIENKPLAPKYKNHKLQGKFSDHWECHVEPD